MTDQESKRYDLALEMAGDLDIAEALLPPDQDEPSPERLVWLDDTDDDGQPQPWAQLKNEADTQYAHVPL